MNIKSKVESLLFAAVKPLSLKDLSKATCAKESELVSALADLASDYKERGSGIVLLSNNKRYQLASSGENSAMVKDFLKSEVTGELSQASLEALTIIAYRAPITKLELEKIRGINCSLIIRNLLLRGFIEESFSKEHQVNFYNVTLDFMRFLGIEKTSDLPDFIKLSQTESLLSVLEEKLSDN